MRDVKRVEWMSQGKYGLMVHYLVNPKGDTFQEKQEDFNRTVDNFDLDRFMSYIDACDPAWLIFPICQTNVYLLGENEYMDKNCPGHTSKRDLPLEIAKEMKKRGKHFMCYLPGCIDPNIKDDPKYNEVFNWKPKSVHKRDFFYSWAEVFRSFSNKFGEYCDGWWIDGCYDYYTNGMWDWSYWAQAIRSGNPNSAIAFSDGSFCEDKLENISNENDYFPGEVTAITEGQIRLDPGIYFGVKGMTEEGYAPTINGFKFFEPKEKYIDNSLLHALVSFDTLWCVDFNFDTPWIKYPVKDLIKLIKSFSDVGGAVTLNAPIYVKDGEIPQESLEKLIELKKIIK